MRAVEPDTALLSAATSYARKGWPVLPSGVLAFHRMIDTCLVCEEPSHDNA